jgi:hypothetical protein
VVAPEQRLNRIPHSNSFIAEDEEALEEDAEWAGIGSGDEKDASDLVEDHDDASDVAWEDLFPGSSAPIVPAADAPAAERDAASDDEDLDAASDDIDIAIEDEGPKPPKRSGFRLPSCPDSQTLEQLALTTTKSQSCRAKGSG